MYGIWQWGRLQEPQVVRVLGFSRHKTPAVSTLHLIFSQLDVSSFEAALHKWATTNLDEVEDASQIRTGSAPQVMAALRNVVLALLRAAGFQNMASALREIGWSGGALLFLGLSPQ